MDSMDKNHELKIFRAFILFVCVLLVTPFWGRTYAAEPEEKIVRVAVAANFQSAFEQLARAFEKESAYQLEAVTGASGKLYAQIRNGAPYHLFLPADAEHATRLEDEGLAVKGSRFTYAVGRLAVYTNAVQSAEVVRQRLASGDFTHLAVAKPELAPYGAAAIEMLKRLGVWEDLKEKVVYGENVTQAYQFVRGGGAELGVVAYAQVVQEKIGGVWLVPENLHTPICQDAVLLTGAREHPGAKLFIKFLKLPAAGTIIKKSGYEAEPVVARLPSQ
ncbi:MAG: molybdate ABC transporter substrate-binding protein [Candidatus Hydrogenedentes bacterium]|nr:molybdate ABC transporter substrate-binding protein [Candidatus Hydrogenedentota bacterium]